MNGACSNFFCPAAGKGSKDQISFNLKYGGQFEIFLYKTLCASSKMKDTKHIRRDFHSVAWVMPQKWDFGCLVAAAYPICYPPPGALGRGKKVNY